MKSITTLCFILAMFSAIAQNVDLSMESNDLKIKKIAEGTYMHISYLETERFGRVPCNGIIFIDQGEVIIFDTPIDNRSSSILLDHLEDNNLTTKVVIATHFHADCTGGLDEFHKRKIPSYGISKTLELAEKREERIPMHEIAIADTFKIGNQDIHTRFLGEAHTVDNIFCYIPSSGVLFGGCAVKQLGAGYGNLADANAEAWPMTVEKARATFPKAQTIVPGHGEEGNSELLDYTIELFSNYVPDSEQK